MINTTEAGGVNPSLPSPDRKELWCNGLWVWRSECWAAREAAVVALGNSSAEGFIPRLKREPLTFVVLGKRRGSARLYSFVLDSCERQSLPLWHGGVDVSCRWWLDASEGRRLYVMPTITPGGPNHGAAADVCEGRK